MNASKDDNAVENGIEAWIEKAGYALELRTARALRQAGFETVIQSEHYFDFESKQHRETDVVAYGETKIDKSQLFVALVFECKATKNKPWVVFTRDKELPDTVCITQRAWTGCSSALKVAVSRDSVVQQLSTLKVPLRAGYKLAVAHNESNEDATYKASMSVVNACQGFISHLEKVSSQIHALALPFLVLGGTLYAAELGPSGKLEVKRVDDIVLAWRNRVLGHHTFIRVFTEQGLIGAASGLLADTNTILQRVGAIQSAKAP